jgi:hypothetical protein
MPFDKPRGASTTLQNWIYKIPKFYMIFGELCGCISLALQQKVSLYVK